MVHLLSILELSGRLIIDRSMDREKYFKTDEKLKKMRKPMYAEPVSVFSC